MRTRCCEVVFVLVWVTCALCAAALAEDWPTYNHDNARSGVVKEALQPGLHEVWRFEPVHRPEPAWPGPAKQNYWHRLSGLHGAVNYDRAYHVAVAADRVFFGSSADDKVYCLNATDGSVRWAFFTEGPVRLAPTVVGKRVYAGSDDGVVYCLDRADGRLLWRYRPVEADYRLPGNGRIMSLWPIRTGVVVQDETAYFCAGLFPTQGAYLCAVDARTGVLRWKEKIDISPQGYMLATAKHLFVPTGRTGPAMFDRSNGRHAGNVSSPGGTFALITDDGLVSGPGRGEGAVGISDTGSKKSMATFEGLRMIARGEMAYIQSHQEIQAFNRTRYLEFTAQIGSAGARQKEIEKKLKRLNKENDEELVDELTRELAEIKAKTTDLNKQAKACFLWKQRSQYSHSMIMAGDVLFLGGQDSIAAVRTADAKQIWTGTVTGKAMGLAVADGRLYVSTDTGTIHCFGSKEANKRSHTQLADTSFFETGSANRIYANAAKLILDKTHIRQGYCLVLDSGEGRLAYQLAKNTDLKIICVEKDRKKVDASRQALDRAGLYGRVVVHHITSDKLPYADYFANLIVSDKTLATGLLPPDPVEVFRLLRPEGGAVFLGTRTNITESKLRTWADRSNAANATVINEGGLWVNIVRGKLAGAGEWTHLHADPSNSACSNDQLVKGSMQLQWFGPPGPRDMIDRHHRNVAPLYKDGRIFVPGDNVVWAVDAYNGTVNWQKAIPGSRRLGVFLDSGSMAVDSRFLYVAVDDECRVYNVESGELSAVHKVPKIVGGRKYHWGYMACVKKLLVASAHKAKASYTETSYEGDKALWYRNMKLVTSDYLFAVDHLSADTRWTYKGGAVLDTTITIGGNRVYFVETTSPRAMADTSGKMPVAELFDGGDQNLVALDLQSGNVIYRKKLDVGMIQEPVYLNYADEILVFSGSNLVDKHVHYYYYAFAAATGQARWQADHNSELPTDGGHGEYNRHPTIVGHIVYAWPYAYDLKSGTKVEGWKFNRQGHGCGAISASAEALFWRGHNPWMYDLAPGGGPVRLNKATRPGCWINIIPAGGLVLIPEASSGCTCGYPLQTSLAYRPVSAD